MWGKRCRAGWRRGWWGAGSDGWRRVVRAVMKSKRGGECEKRSVCEGVGEVGGAGGWFCGDWELEEGGGGGRGGGGDGGWPGSSGGRGDRGGGGSTGRGGAG